jgi:hypothetical protein
MFKLIELVIAFYSKNAYFSVLMQKHTSDFLKWAGKPSGIANGIIGEEEV